MPWRRKENVFGCARAVAYNGLPIALRNRMTQNNLGDHQGKRRYQPRCHRSTHDGGGVPAPMGTRCSRAIPCEQEGIRCHILSTYACKTRTRS